MVPIAKWLQLVWKVCFHMFSSVWVKNSIDHPFRNGNHTTYVNCDLEDGSFLFCPHYPEKGLQAMCIAPRHWWHVLSALGLSCTHLSNRRWDALGDRDRSQVLRGKDEDWTHQRGSHMQEWNGIATVSEIANKFGRTNLDWKIRCGRDSVHWKTYS